MSETERLIVEMLWRLFWLVSLTPGVPTYAEDVKLFDEAAVAAGCLDADEAARRIAAYEKAKQS